MKIASTRGQGNESWNIPEKSGVGAVLGVDTINHSYPDPNPDHNHEPIEMTHQDALLCSTFLRLTMIDHGETMEMVEKKLQAIMIQRIFLPGRFQLRSVVSTLHQGQDNFTSLSSPHASMMMNYSLSAVIEMVIIACQQRALLHVSDLSMTNSGGSGGSGGSAGTTYSDRSMMTTNAFSASRFTHSKSVGQVRASISTHHGSAMSSPLVLLQGLLSWSEKELNGLLERYVFCMCLYYPPPIFICITLCITSDVDSLSLFPPYLPLTSPTHHPPLLHRYGLRQLVHIQCLSIAFLDFLQLCTYHARWSEGLTIGCLQRHHPLPLQLATSTTISSVSIIAPIDASLVMGVPVMVARRSCRVHCVVLPMELTTIERSPLTGR